MHTTRSSLLALSLVCACTHADTGASEPTSPSPSPNSAAAPHAAALASIRAEDLAAHVQVLASDAYEGRFPGSAGEAKTLAYLAATMARIGVEPAGSEGYLQPVALSSTTVAPSSKIVARAPGSRRGGLELRQGVDVVLGCKSGAPQLTPHSDGIVFGGYGIVAPEHGWDDYAGVDLRGKTVLVLSGDPGPTREDPAFFEGLALTHHGTHKAKIEVARARGAAAVFVIHDGEASGFPWERLASNASRSKMQLREPSKASSSESGPEQAGGRALLSGLLPLARASELLALAGLELDELRLAAKADGFSARAAPLELDYELTRSFEPIDSHNLVAWIPGSTQPDEYVIYTAHWDHVGTAPPPAADANADGEADTDRIFNGAVDNATGTAALLELAQAYATLEQRPARSVVFLATTAEEQGLLGSFHYVEHPLFPLAQTMAVINMDGLFPFGATKGMTVVALGSSELEDYMAPAAEAVGRALYPDPAPQFGAFFRSDHYPFAAKGVPAIFAVGGPAHDPAVGETVDLERFMDYIQHDYHQVSDEYDPETWDLAGVVQDVEVYFRTGLAIAEDSRVPNWYEHSAFRPLRDDMRNQ